MCKPAGEVSNLSQLESHSTRGRAMLLWRILDGQIPWDSRTAELMYQTTLDSISEVWCISHYPVSRYLADARAAIVEAGLIPATVRAALDRGTIDEGNVRGDTVLLGGEAAQRPEPGILEPALHVLRRAGIDAAPLVAASGVLAYALGDRARCAMQARHIAQLLEAAGARTVIADGPQTAWALRVLYPAMNIPLPPGITVSTLAESLAAARLPVARHDGLRVLLHDSRSASLIAESMAVAEAIQPGFQGPEEKLGTGEVFEAPRQLLDRMGASRVTTVWSRSLCRSCGADDGLSLTYPALAAGLARQCLDEARRLGAQMIVCDSPLCAAHLADAATSGDVPVQWLPVLLQEA